jgi:hypothetical protein
MQSLGAPPASASTPAYRPRSPDRPVPPANIPGAGRRSEPVITSSAGAPGNQSGATNELRSPQPILDARRYNSEGASVFEAAPAKPMAKQ